MLWLVYRECQSIGRGKRKRGRVRGEDDLLYGPGPGPGPGNSALRYFTIHPQHLSAVGYTDIAWDSLIIRRVDLYDCQDLAWILSIEAISLSCLQIPPCA